MRNVPIRATVHALLVGAALACGFLASGEHPLGAPQGPLDASGQPAVIVNPHARGAGTANSIQEGLELVRPGGKVLVLPGLYEEAITISKGVTIEALATQSGPVVVWPAGTPDSVIEIATSHPVVLRGLTVHVPGANGVRGVGPVDVTIERSTIVAVNPPLGASNLVIAANEVDDPGTATLVVRQSVLDGTVTEQRPGVPRPQSFALRAQGDVNALFVGNLIRRSGGACIFVATREDLGGALHVGILHNDLDECHPMGRVAAILVGPPGGTNVPSPTRPLTATGTVDIVGNLIRNSTQDCLDSAIAYEVLSGVIERNVIADFVQPCATPTNRNRPSAIWVGRLSAFPFPPVAPIVRLNDISGNAHAGLRMAPNQSVPIDARCNYWGSETGPSGLGSGDGDAILVETGGAVPLFVPFASGPIAATSLNGC